MDDLISVGARKILSDMIKHGFELFGDPSRDVPFFFSPTDLKHRVPGKIDPPGSVYCRELLKRKLIEPEDWTKQADRFSASRNLISRPRLQTDPLPARLLPSTHVLRPSREGHSARLTLQRTGKPRAAERPIVKVTSWTTSC